MCQRDGIEAGNRQEKIQRMTAFHCAQVLAGIKASNIFIMEDGQTEELSHILAGTGVEFKILWAGQEKAAYLLYRRERTARILMDSRVQEFFRSFGYDSFNLDQVLERLAVRYEAYAGGQNDFPHEIGLILEYPLCDVKGFIEHKGRDFLFSGYWKVYENPEETRRLFAVYTAIQKKVMEGVEKGLMLWQIFSAFRNQNVAA